LPEFQPVVEMIRELMKEYTPAVEEIMSYGIPTYRARRIKAVSCPTKKDITFAFSRGVDMENKYGLLRGVGKVSKHIKIKNLDQVNEDALRYYIDQALEIDTRE
jgi:hypothetical protein